jgi:hypothetical protein
MKYVSANVLKVVWRFRIPVAIRIRKIKPATLKLSRKQLPTLAAKKPAKQTKIGRRNKPRSRSRRRA